MSSSELDEGVLTSEETRDSQPASMVDMFRHRLVRDASSSFLFDEDLTATTFHGAQQAALRLVALLAQRGIRPSAKVGVYAPNVSGAFIASLAIWYLEATAVSVGTVTPPGEAATLFSGCGVGIVVTVGHQIEGHALGHLEVIALEAVQHDGARPRARPGVPAADQPAVVAFTSGTTGAPKPIERTHADFVTASKIRAQTFARTPEFRPRIAPERVPPSVSFTPFGHLAGYEAVAFALWVGRSIVLVPKFRVDTVGAILDRFPTMDVLRLNPTMIHALATAEEDLPLDTLRYVYSGTAPLPAEAKRRFEDRYGIPILQGYGLSETGPIALGRLRDVESGSQPADAVGRIVDSVDVRIVDPSGEMRSPDEEGEILVRPKDRGPSLIRSSGTGDAEGWVHTGDVGRLTKDGFLSITGRVAEMLVVGGFNVFPREVEDVLRASPYVVDAVVVGMPDERLGEVPVAGVVWESSPHVEELEREAREYLAPYKIPRKWVALDVVLRTARDKLDRAAAKADIEQRIDDWGGDRVDEP